MDSDPCYYKTLQLSFHAKPEEIKASYRALARRYHPDKSTISANPQAREEVPDDTAARYVFAGIARVRDAKRSCSEGAYDLPRQYEQRMSSDASLIFKKTTLGLRCK